MNISIIVPVYNAEKYIRRCVESVIYQLSSEDELILVDDGSNDDSGKICDQYSRNFSNITVVHQQNGGEAVARNSGVAIAKGDYVVYIDADDFADANMIKCIKKYKSLDSDVILFEYIEEDGEKLNKNYNIESVVVHTYEEIDKEQFVKCNFLAKDIVENCNFNMRSVWAKAYRREFLIQNEIEFDAGIKIGEDMLYTLKVYQKSKKMACVEYPIYHYFFQNMDSITNRYKPDLEEIIASYVSTISNWLEKNPQYVDYHANYRLNDIVLYMKYDLFHLENMDCDKVTKCRMEKILNENGYKRYYKLAQKSGLLKYYPLSKRITFFCALHRFYFGLKCIARIKYRKEIK